MSPVAADCDSADSAPGNPDPFLVDSDAEVVVAIDAPVEAPPVEVDDDLLVEVDDGPLDEAPHPAISAAPVSTQTHQDLRIETMLTRLPERA